MRKQYHFRHSERGLLAWDVDKLVELTRGLVPVKVSLSEIGELDETYWDHDRRGLTVREVAEHARLMKEADLAYPVILSPDRRVMDGMHRVAKAEAEGRSHVDAYILTALPPPDYVGVAPEDLPY